MARQIRPVSESRFPEGVAAPEEWMCDEGMALWATFTQARPEDCEFIQPADLLDAHSSAFSGIPEWDAFANHTSGCLRCKFGDRGDSTARGPGA
jgi:hypothetical protein